MILFHFSSSFILKYLSKILLFLGILLSSFLFCSLFTIERTKAFSEEAISSYSEYFQSAQQEANGDNMKAFEALKKKYHEDMNTYFNEHITEISKSAYTSEQKDVEVCTPFIKKEETNIDTVYENGLQKFWEYEAVLQNIDIRTTKNSTLFEEGFLELNTQEYMLLEEIENAHTSFLLTFQMYSEMRQMYPVHRDLECLIFEMEQYRTALRKFVDRIIIMPAKFYNYASEKQQS